MRKYFFILPSLNGGGAELVLINLANYLSKNNEVTIFLINPEGNHQHRIFNKVNLIVSKRKRSKGAYFELLYLLKKKKPDALLACLVYPITIIGILKNLGLIKCRIVCRISNQIDMDLISINSFLIKKLYKYSISKFDAVIVQNDVMKDQVLKISQKSKIIKILNPVLSTDLKANSNCRDNFIWVGRLSEQKNYNLLFDASEKINYKINVYAKLQENKDFIERVNASSSSMINLNDFDSNVKKYMSESRALIITSIYEGLPNVLLESLSVGTPIITSHYIGGGHELLDSSNSIYFKTSDDLAYILNNFDDTLFDNTKIAFDIKKKCTIELIANEYEVVLNG